MSERKLPVNEPIAIVALSCRFPDAPTPEAYWQLLRERRSATRLVPVERWNNDVFYDAEPRTPGKTNARRAAFIADAFSFEPRFFGISDREAEHMDPQHRLALELSWEAFERAGLTLDMLRGGRTGVYVGTMNNDYAKTSISSSFSDVDAYHLTGNWGSFLPGHIAYFFGLCGPVVAVDAACASSLVAVHLASQALRAGECDIALAGGISLMLSPELSIVLTKAGALSPEGESRAFDASANGMGRGEGGAMFVLKRVTDALEAGDPIVALAVGSAINHGGQSAGFTVPNGQAQARVIREALRAADCLPDDISYLEAHGTGTRLGDPIEARALSEVFRRDPTTPLAIGSVKTNLGHLDSAAGMAGLIKVALGMQQELVPAQLHFETGNPEIDWDRAGLRVVTAAEAWPRRPGSPRHAGVSAFGMSGINAHVVLREAPFGEPATPIARHAEVLPLTAHSQAALRSRAGQWAERLLAGNDYDCAQLLCTAAHRLTHLDRRLVARAGSRTELATQLREFADGRTPPDLLVGQRQDGADVCFVFSGQGSAWGGMASNLWDESPIFRSAVTECLAFFADDVRPAVLEVLCRADQSVDDTRIAQPAIFCVQVGLLRLWAELGVRPSLVVGHSLGEVTAAYAAGLLNLEGACRVVALRSSLMQAARGGRMAHVALSREATRERIAGFAGVEVAAVNGPNSTVITGDAMGVERAARELSAAGTEVRLLELDYAFHSAKLDVAEAALLGGLRDLTSASPAIVMISTVTGEPVQRVDASYWFSNARRPVDFLGAMEQCTQFGCAHFVEVGPHPVLLRDMLQTLQVLTGDSAPSVVHSLSRRDSNLKAIQSSALRLFVAGVAIDWTALGLERAPVTNVPAYPWIKKEYRLIGSRDLQPAHDAHSLLGDEGEVASDTELKFWQRQMKVGTFGYLQDHGVGAAIVLPGALLLAMFAAAARTENQAGARIALRDVKFLHPIVLSDEPQILQISLKSGVALAASREGRSGFRNHCSARVTTEGMVDDAHAGFRHLDRLAAELKTARVNAAPDADYDGAEHRRRMLALGMKYGPQFSGVTRVVRRGPEAIVEIAGEHLVSGAESEHGMHPTLLDCCFQAAAVFLDGKANFLPASIRAITWPSSRIPRAFTCHVRVTEFSASRLVVEIAALDDAGALILRAEGFELAEVGKGREVQRRDEVFEVAWRELVDSTQIEMPSGCIVFDDEQGFAESFIDRLRGKGVRVVKLVPGPGFAEIGPDQFSISPDRLQCVAAFFARRPETLTWPQIHFWNLRPHSVNDAVDIESFMRSGCGSLATLLQGRQHAGVRGSVPLVVITRGAQAVEQSALGSPLQAAAWGFMRTARVEMPSLAARCIDVAASDTAQVADQLLREVFIRLPPQEVVLRDARRLVPVLTRTAGSGPEVTISPEGTHVILGGTGGVGLSIARSLVGKGARHVALFARHAPSASALAVIGELEARGARVKAYSVDATSHTALGDGLRTASLDLAPIVGIVHAAGIVEDTSISRITWAQLWNVLAPKVLPACSLDRLADDHDLQYLSLFSSISSVLGNPGQANYAAANAVLDALAEHRASAHKVASAINWGAWEDTGMLAGQTETTKRLSERGVGALPPDRASAAFFAVQNGSRRTVALFEPKRWLQTYSSPWLRDFFRELTNAEQVDIEDVRAELASVSVPEARRRITNKVKALLAAVLRTDPSSLDENTSFDRLGVDSMLSVEFGANVEAVFRVELGVSALWSFPKLRSLSEHITDLLGLSSERNEPMSPVIDLTFDESAALSGLVDRISNA